MIESLRALKSPRLVENLRLKKNPCLEKTGGTGKEGRPLTV
jgi:hypothetical protein